MPSRHHAVCARLPLLVALSIAATGCGASHKVIYPLQPTCFGATYVPASGVVVAGYNDEVVAWDGRTGRVVRRFAIHGEDQFGIPRGEAATPIVVSGDGKRVAFAIGGRDRPFIVSDLATGAEVARGDGGPLAFSWDGSRLAFTRLWSSPRIVVARVDALGGEAEYEAPESAEAVAFSRSGRHAVVGARNSQATFWDTVERRELGAKWPMLETWAVAVSADGSRAAMANGVASTEDKGPSCAEACEVVVLSVPKGDRIQKLDTGRDTAIQLAFSPDGANLVAVQTTRFPTDRRGDRVTLFDVTKGNRIAWLPHPDVTSAEFLPNGEEIVSVSQSCTVKYWDTWTGKPKSTVTLQPPTP
jgi:WD40 repeat protein